MSSLRAEVDRSLQQFLLTGDAVLPLQEPLVLFVCAVSAAVAVAAAGTASRSTDLIVADETHPGVMLRLWGALTPEGPTAGDVVVLTGASTRVWRGTTTLSAGSGAWLRPLVKAARVATWGASTGEGSASSSIMGLVFADEQLGPWARRCRDAIAARVAAVCAWAVKDSTPKAVLTAAAAASATGSEALARSMGEDAASGVAKPQTAALARPGSRTGASAPFRPPARVPALPALPAGSGSVASASSAAVVPPSRVADAALLLASGTQLQRRGAAVPAPLPLPGQSSAASSRRRIVNVEVCVLNVMAVTEPPRAGGTAPAAQRLAGLAVVTMPATPTVPLQLRLMVAADDAGAVAPPALLRQLAALASTEEGRGMAVVLGPLELQPAQGPAIAASSSSSSSQSNGGLPVLCAGPDTRILATKVKLQQASSSNSSAAALPPPPTLPLLPSGSSSSVPGVADPTCGLIGEAPLSWGEAMAYLGYGSSVITAAVVSPTSSLDGVPVTFTASIRSIVLPSAGAGLGGVVLDAGKEAAAYGAAAAAEKERVAGPPQRPWTAVMSQVLLTPAPLQQGGGGAGAGAAAAAAPSTASTARSLLTLPATEHGSRTQDGGSMPGGLLSPTAAAASPYLPLSSSNSSSSGGVAPLVCPRTAARLLTARLPPPWIDGSAPAQHDDAALEHNCVFVPLLLELVPPHPSAAAGAAGSGGGEGQETQATQLVSSHTQPTNGSTTSPVASSSAASPASVWVLVDDSALVSTGLLGGLGPDALAAALETGAPGAPLHELDYDDDAVMINGNSNARRGCGDALAAAVLQTLYAAVAGSCDATRPQALFTVSVLRRGAGDAIGAPTQSARSALFATGLYPT